MSGLVPFGAIGGYPLPALPIVPSTGFLRDGVGPTIPAYALPLTLPKPFRWVLGSTETNNGITAIASIGPGNPGAWLDMPLPDQGADLADADALVGVGGNVWRVLPAGTLTANRALVLDPVGARQGHVIEVTRFDVSAHTVTVTNGGTGAGLLVTLPASARSNALFYFNGVDWLLRRSGLML